MVKLSANCGLSAFSSISALSMVSIFRNSETTVSIAIEGWMCAFTSLILLLSIFILIKHISTHDTYTNTYFTICALSPLICSFILTIVVGIIFNNSVIPSINSHYSFIDEHCDVFAIICSTILHIIRYSTWIFYLYRIKHYFANSKKYHLSTLAFGINIIVYILFTSISIYLHYSWSKAADSHFSAILFYQKYKSCRVFLDDKMRTSVIITFMVNDGLISVYLLYLLYSKTMSTEREQQQNDQLSVHFSQRDTRSIINTQIMRRCILFGLLSLSMQWSFILMGVLFEFNHALSACCSCIFNAIPILASFDMQNPIKLLCPFCSTNTDTENNSDSETQQTELTVTQSQREYMNKIMKAYYKVPTRAQSRNIVINNHRN